MVVEAKRAAKKKSLESCILDRGERICLWISGLGKGVGVED